MILHQYIMCHVEFKMQKEFPSEDSKSSWLQAEFLSRYLAREWLTDESGSQTLWYVGFALPAILIFPFI